MAATRMALVTGGSGFLGGHVVLQLLDAGYRVASSDDLMSMLAVAGVLRERLGERARKVPTRELPNWLVRCAARFDRKLRPLVPLLDSTRRATSDKARRVLGWTPRAPEDAIVATAESLIKFGAVS